MNIFLTGFTGNLGPSIAAALADHRVVALVRNGAAPAMPNVTTVTGDHDHLPEGVCGDAEVIIHAAANTGFTTPLAELRAVNVTGTEKLLAYARRCPRLRRFVHLSTCCACGTASGTIPEAPLKRPDNFINPYEQSKWEAEQAVLASGVPHQIVRLSIVAGSEMDGHVRRPGALHHALLWLYRGLKRAEVLCFTQIFERTVHRRFTEELEGPNTPEPAREAFRRMIEDEKDHLGWVAAWLLTQPGARDCLRHYQELDRRVAAELKPYESCLWAIPGLRDDAQPKTPLTP